VIMALPKLVASLKTDLPFWPDWRLEPRFDGPKNSLESGVVFLLDFPAQVLVRHDQPAQVRERSHDRYTSVQRAIRVYIT
jgi:hypothetical protein